jgi:hypothetical protein
VPIGAPGTNTLSDYGASQANIQRAMKCWDILAALGDVDTNCIMAFGHSRGAFVTTAIAGSYPYKFSAAGHTAGGTLNGGTYPTFTMAQALNMPYIFHHGDNDNTVPLVADQKLDSIMTANGVQHQFYVYPGYTHSDVSQDSLMLARTQQWFSSYGCMVNTGFSNVAKTGAFYLYPNPASEELWIHGAEHDLRSVKLYSLSGQLLAISQSAHLALSGFPPGLYLVRIETASGIFTHKLILRAGL